MTDAPYRSEFESQKTAKAPITTDDPIDGSDVVQQFRVRRAFVAGLPFALALPACDAPATVTPPARPATPATPATPAAPAQGAASIRFALDTAVIFAGTGRPVSVIAYDPQQAQIGSDRATITSSNASVATVGQTALIPVVDPRTGRTWQELSAVIQFVGAGKATLRVTQDGLTDTVVVVVHGPPRPTSSLVVDSFSLVEYRASCVWACPYLVYAPLLTLREPTGTSSAEVVAVEFMFGGRTTGFCRGSARYSAGLSAPLNGIYDYLWSNDLIFVSVDGVAIPGDSVDARVLVRQADGEIGSIDARGPVRRLVRNPDLPSPIWGGWTCN